MYLSVAWFGERKRDRRRIGGKKIEACLLGFEFSSHGCLGKGSWTLLGFEFSSHGCLEKGSWTLVPA